MYATNYTSPIGSFCVSATTLKILFLTRFQCIFISKSIVKTCTCQLLDAQRTFYVVYLKKLFSSFHRKIFTIYSEVWNKPITIFVNKVMKLIQLILNLFIYLRNSVSSALDKWEIWLFLVMCAVSSNLTFRTSLASYLSYKFRFYHKSIE